MGFFGLEKLLQPVLEFINSWVSNYGVSVIIFTALIKLILLPLDIRSKRKMRQISKLQPQLDAINKKYANDPDRKNAKTMELYKKEKVNPLTSGCLPLLLQLPLLFALLAVLRYAATKEMSRMYEIVVAANQSGDFTAFHDFMAGQRFLWVANIWQPDTFFMPQGNIIPTASQAISLGITYNDAAISAEEYVRQMGPLMLDVTSMNEAIAAGQTRLSQFLQYKELTNGLFILPVLAGVSSILQSKLAQSSGNAKNNPAASGGKFMTWLFPIMSVWICSSANAAFSVYWVVSNLISIGTYLLINFILNKEDEKREREKEVPGMPMKL